MCVHRRAVEPDPEPAPAAEAAGAGASRQGLAPKQAGAAQGGRGLAASRQGLPTASGRWRRGPAPGSAEDPASPRLVGGQPRPAAGGGWRQGPTVGGRTYNIGGRTLPAAPGFSPARGCLQQADPGRPTLVRRPTLVPLLPSRRILSTTTQLSFQPDCARLQPIAADCTGSLRPTTWPHWGRRQFWKHRFDANRRGTARNSAIEACQIWKKKLACEPHVYMYYIYG